MLYNLRLAPLKVIPPGTHCEGKTPSSSCTKEVKCGAIDLQAGVSVPFSSRKKSSVWLLSSPRWTRAWSHLHAACLDCGQALCCTVILHVNGCKERFGPCRTQATIHLH